MHAQVCLGPGGAWFERRVGWRGQGKLTLSYYISKYSSKHHQNWQYGSVSDLKNVATEGNFERNAKFSSARENKGMKFLPRPKGL